MAEPAPEYSPAPEKAWFLPAVTITDPFPLFSAAGVEMVGLDTDGQIKPADAITYDMPDTPHIVGPG